MTSWVRGIPPTVRASVVDTPQNLFREAWSPESGQVVFGRQPDGLDDPRERD